MVVDQDEPGAGKGETLFLVTGDEEGGGPLAVSKGIVHPNLCGRLKLMIE